MADKLDVIAGLGNTLLPANLNSEENQGPRSARVSCTLVAGQNYLLQIGDDTSRELCNPIQTIFVDNTAGANALTVTTSLVAVSYQIPAGSYAILPVYLVEGDSIIFNRVDGGVLPVLLFNFQQPYIVWDADGLGSVTINAFSAAAITALILALGQTTTATPANKAATGASISLIAANASRKGATIFNDGAATLYVNFGAAASATACVVAMAPGAYYELPYPVYTGVVNGLAASGTARVLELV